MRPAKSLRRTPGREARTLVNELTTARPRNEWPGDDLTVRGDAEEELDETMAEERERYFPGGAQWEPATIVRSTTPGRDGVPTIDDNLDADVHAAPRSYPAWNAANSMVVSGLWAEVDEESGYLYNSKLKFKTRAEMRKAMREKYGHIYEEYSIRGRWCVRVPKPAVTQ